MRLDEFQDSPDGGSKSSKKVNSKALYRDMDQRARSSNQSDPGRTKDRLKTQPMAGPKGVLPEATGDEKFDNMMGKISGSTEPQNFNQAQNDRVQNKAENPDAETINALNKMMYDMHVTMQTANRLMQKLTRGR